MTTPQQPAAGRDMTNLPVTSTPVPDLRDKAPWYKPWLAELKVLAMAAVVAVVSVVVEVLNAASTNSSLLGSLPGWLQAVILVAAPTVATYLAGWATKHTHRPGA